MSSQEYFQGLLQGSADFELLIAELLSADNDKRKAAESIFDQLKQHPDACLSHLIRSLRSSPNAEHRSYCAIIVRKVISLTEPSVWSNASPQVQSLIKTELLQAIQSEPERTVVHKVCDTVYELGELLLPDNAWPELLPNLLAALQSGPSGSARLAESALTIIGDLASEGVEQVAPIMSQLLPLLRTHLASDNQEVAIAALQAIGSFIRALEEQPQDLQQLSVMVPGMLTVLTNTLNKGDELAAREAMEIFIEVADSNPKFLKPHLANAVSVFLSIARAEQLDNDTRILATEFLVTLSEARERAPGMMRKLPNFAQSLFETLMQFLLDVEDEQAWHSADTEDNEEGEGDLAQFGQESLDRIAMSLGGKSVVPPAAQLLTAWLADADWRKRHATLLCLAQIAEGCSKVMQEQLEGLVQMCLRGLVDPHARVRWAACQAIGQMCSDLGPELQERCHTKVVPCLMGAMDDFNSPRVQAHAAAALVNFSESCDAEIVSPYLETLIGKLVALLQNGKKLVQEGALTALASVADAAQEHFIRYYDAVMPLLIQILLTASDKSHRLLRAKALECVSLVGMAVGRDKFRTDAVTVMQLMQQLHSSISDDHDPTLGYLLQAGARLCKCLGEEMVPYLNVVMPPLLKSASLQPDVKVRTAEEGIDDDEEDEDEDIEKVQVGDKVLSIRTSTLEEKATACNMLCCYADELKGVFYPYVAEVAPLMVSLLKFYFYEEVRRAAVSSLPALLRSISVAVEENKAQPSVLKEMVDFCWPPLLAALKKEPDPGVLAAMLEAIREMVDIAGAGHLQQTWVEQSFTEFKEVISQSETRRQERLQRLDGEELDEEDRDALEEREEEEMGVIDNTSDAVCSFLKAFGDDVLPYVEGLMPLIAPLLHKDRSPEDRRIALCIVDDLLDSSPAGRAKYLDQSMPILVECATSDHEDLRQCAVYGLGIAAAKSGAAFKRYCPQVLQVLLTVVQAPDAKSEDNESPTDNAVSALGKIIEHQADAVDTAPIVPVWLAAMPLKGDKDEAIIVHEQLLRLVEARDSRVLGELPSVVRIFVEVLGHGTKLISKEVVGRVVGLLQQAQSAVPTEVVQQSMLRLSTEQQATFQAAMAGHLPK